MPFWSVKLSTSSALKLLLIETTADSILVSSTSETAALPVIARGASFSVYGAGAGSIAERTGASFSCTICISRLTTLLLTSPSFISIDRVRLTPVGESLTLV